MNRNFKIALALGGGGARGLAHIGVLKVLEEGNVPIDLVVGTSMGAIIGGAYALLADAKALEKKILGFLDRKELLELESFAAKSLSKEKYLIIEKLVNFVKKLYLWNLKAVKRCLVDIDPIEKLIKDLFGDKDFSQTKIPFVSIATDLETGEEVNLAQGEIARAVLASSAIPGIFPPIMINNRLLVDGGVISQTPIEAAHRLGSDFIIAVNIEESICCNEFNHGIDILFQTDCIRVYELNKMKLKLADFIITPPVGNISWARFSMGKDCIRKGEEATLNILEEIKKKIAKARRRNFLKRLIPFFNKAS